MPSACLGADVGNAGKSWPGRAPRETCYWTCLVAVPDRTSRVVGLPTSAWRERLDVLELRLTLRIGTEPKLGVETLLSHAVQVFSAIEISLTHQRTDENLVPTLNVGKCGETPTNHQIMLYEDRPGLLEPSLVVFFFRRLHLPHLGCASAPAGKPTIAISRNCTKWTLAHEIGHALGLRHVLNDDANLMYVPTANISALRPRFEAGQISTMLSSNLLVQI
jgi:hypothetical protein